MPNQAPPVFSLLTHLEGTAFEKNRCSHSSKFWPPEHSDCTAGKEITACL